MLPELLDAEDSPLDVTALLEGYDELLLAEWLAPKLEHFYRLNQEAGETEEAIEEIPMGGRDFSEHLAFARQQIGQRQAEESYKESLLPSRGKGRYTPEMLRRFLDWTGETCAFPLCDEPQTRPSGVHYYEGTNWHLCPLHRTRFSITRGVHKWKKKHGRTDTTSPENRRAISQRRRERQKLKKEIENGTTASGTPHAELGAS